MLLLNAQKADFILIKCGRLEIWIRATICYIKERYGNGISQEEFESVYFSSPDKKNIVKTRFSCQNSKERVA